MTKFGTQGRSHYFFHRQEKDEWLGESLKKCLKNLDPPIEGERLIEMGAVYVNSKRAVKDHRVCAEDVLRIHFRPKRYPVHEVDWDSCVLRETESYLVVDKPQGIPVGPTLDNVLECCVTQMSLRGRVCYPTTRLDVVTGGALVFAKTKSFQRHYNAEVSSGRVEKKYRAFSRACPPVGLHIHYMERSDRAPRKVFLQESEDRVECRLEILAVEEFSGIFQSDVRLLTGRTHQIRAQFELMKCPIWNDELYGGIQEVPEGDKIGLFCSELVFCDEQGSRVRVSKCKESMDRFCRKLVK